MILFVRSTFSSCDGRIQNHRLELDLLGLEYSIFDWPRTKNELNLSIANCDPRVKSFKWIRGEYGSGFRSILGRLGFYFFLIIQLFTKRHKFSCIVLSDLDMGVLIFVLRLFYKGKIIFDIYDHYSDMYSDNKYLCYLEKYCVRKADAVIICADWRMNFIDIEYRDKVVVIENIPPLNIVSKDIPHVYTSKIKLLYIGVLQPRLRGLEDLISVIKFFPDSVELTIGGFGPLKNYIESVKLSNVNFLGEVDNRFVANYIKNTDIIVGFYYVTNAKHHVNAAPNKFYEHLLFGKPLLTNYGTRISEFVLENNTGFVVHEGVDSMRNFLSTLERTKIDETGKNASRYHAEIIERKSINFKSTFNSFG